VTGYRFHPDARGEYRSAVAWYRDRSRDAATGMIDAIADGLRSIRETPLAWAHWAGTSVRRRVLRRFPYSLFYVVNAPADQVVILAVAHHSRRPGYWIDRAP
jgi:toxin ParE1/3/4